jgi:hypothetical protein
MTEHDKKPGVLIPIAMVALLFAALTVYAGYRHALRDVCAAGARFRPAAYAAIAASVISITLSLWGAVRRRTVRSTLLASITVLASIAVALYGALLIWTLGFAEFAPAIQVVEDGQVGFGFEEEGFRISGLEVTGPAGRWRIEAIDKNRPPLIQSIGRFTLGQTPRGYTEVESTLNPAALEDGNYRVEATASCSYRPASSSFTISQSRVVKK